MFVASNSPLTKAFEKGAPEVPRSHVDEFGRIFVMVEEPIKQVSAVAFVAPTPMAMASDAVALLFRPIEMHCDPDPSALVPMASESDPEAVVPRPKAVAPTELAVALIPRATQLLAEQVVKRPMQVPPKLAEASAPLPMAVVPFPPAEAPTPKMTPYCAPLGGLKDTTFMIEELVPIFRSPVMVSPVLRTLREALPVTVPVKFAVTVPAEKFPDPLRRTMVLAVFAAVAVVAELLTFPAVEMVANLVSTMAADALTSASTSKELDNTPDEFAWTRPVDAKLAIVTTPEESILIRKRDPVESCNAPEAELNPAPVPTNKMEGAVESPKGTVSVPVNVSPVFNTFKEADPVTFPVRFEVIVVAAKLPDASLETMEFAVFASVAVVAELLTLPTVVMVASLVSAIAADGLTSALTIKEDVNKPAPLACTTPKDAKFEIVTTPVESILIRSVDPVDNCRALDAELKPAPVVANNKLGEVARPIGNVNEPDMLSPVFKTFKEADPVTFPVKFAVTVPAAKLPDASLDTMALAVFASVAVVAELLTFPDVAMVANFVSTIPADGLTSAFTTREDVTSPVPMAVCKIPLAVVY